MWCIGCHLGIVFKDSESNFAVVRPVLHLHLFVSRLTRSWMALTFSTLSQPMVRWWPSVSYSPPITVEGLSRTMLFLSACLHILMIQHDLFQWRHKASVDGIIWFSKVILRDVLVDISEPSTVLVQLVMGRLQKFIKVWSRWAGIKPWGMFLVISGSN